MIQLFSAPIAWMRTLLNRWRTGAFAPPASGPEPVLHAALFNGEQMERHGKTLAQGHLALPKAGPDLLLARLAENEAVLHQTYAQLRESASARHLIDPAGEWLLDNFYLIEEQIRTARLHFSKGYSRVLPLLSRGASKGLPRVYDIALELISHGDGRLDLDSLRRLIVAYQGVQLLTLGELWAIPIMLRLAMIDNLRRVGCRVAQCLTERSQATAWADQMIAVALAEPKGLILVVADMARSDLPMAPSFVAELVRRLRGQSAALTMPLHWVELRLSESGQSTEQVVQDETQRQAASQLSISNSISSVRTLGATDWREFVESMSAVEQRLKQDPAGVYGRMDFATRDQYRHAVERLARYHGLTEVEVALRAVSLAVAASDTMPLGADARQCHVGHYLIGRGLQTHLIPQLPPRGFSWQHPMRPLRLRHPVALYLGALAVLSAVLALQMWWIAQLPSWSPLARLALFAVVLLGCSQLAVTLVNWVVSLTVRPMRLARMDHQHGLAPGTNTLVVVPALLASVQHSVTLAQDLELRFLGNQDPLLYFGLLTDFGDADQAHQSGDDAALEMLRQQIDALNQRYGRADWQPFYLFHRPRCWNGSEGVWMGAERKRGKLEALNRLLLQGDTTPFMLVVGPVQVLRQVRYVITLDTDTQLPRDSARLLVSTMAHPLNRAVLDAKAQRVTQGYGILQPRMAATLPSTNRSGYARLFGGDQGVDPYTGAASDVYQDLFGEGSYIGKGIYEVAVFEQALLNRFPDNRILSHDLLEGCYARCGVASDVILYEDTPLRYLSDARRRHRWIRGDWQIASWLGRRVPLARGGLASNPLSALSQWKLLDNLRRSLVAPALMTILVTAWVNSGFALAWSLGVLGIVFFPALVHASVEGWRKSDETMAREHARQVLHALRRKLSQSLFMLACLPFEAWYSLDAVVRTLARLIFTHHPLLQWQTDSGEVVRPGPGVAWRVLWPGPGMALAVGALLVCAHPAGLWVAAPFMLLWGLLPWLEQRLSRALQPDEKSLDLDQKAFLGRLARRTWHFFEVHVTAQEHHLPPDNYQDHPVKVIAHRTSPTNIGLALLGNLAAHDLGYLGTGALLERTRQCFQTLQDLPRHLGHFFNWYDTRTLAALPPLFVSTVDSGNLAGHLLTLRQGLLAMGDTPLLSTQPFHALHDTLGILLELCQQPGHALTLRDMALILGRIQQVAPAPVGVAAQQRHAWRELQAVAARLLPQRSLTADSGHALDEDDGDEFQHWVLSLNAQIAAHRAELEDLLPDGLVLPPELDQAGLTLRSLAVWLPMAAAAAPASALADGGVADVVRQRVRHRLLEMDALAAQCHAMAQMPWAFLENAPRHLLSVGYSVDQRRQDDACYDLLASEARLASYLAISQGQIAQEDWFALGRLVTASGGAPILLSWSGSMFEYLMPLLVMPSYRNTLLDQTCRSAVLRQMAYCHERGVAWGISESGYNAVDASLNYQYRAFGVPGTGLKRGLAEDLVIAPYASALALMVMPVAACQNLQRLDSEGLMRRYGLYEAVDYTASRLPRGAKHAVVRSFMAHHQGMTLLALVQVLRQQPMQKRFMADALLRANELLLHERIPNPTRLQHETAGPANLHSVEAGHDTPIRIILGAETQAPQLQLLSNGRYHLMLTHTGGGYSRWRDLAVTRWREDPTRDPWGQFCFLRDPGTGQFWSVGHQPTRHPGESYQALFSEGRAEFRRHDHGFETHAEISVSPEDDIELRRVRITNTTRARRSLEVTSYAEVVLAPAMTDSLHPAFSNLFVQTEVVAPLQAILCTRRPRASTEAVVWLLHLMSVHGATSTEISFETDRRRFIGRTRSLESPRALLEPGPLSGTCGAVLDPVVAIRHLLHLEPLQTITLDIVTGMTETRSQAMALLNKYRDKHLADRVFDLAWTHGWVNLQQINASEADAQLYNCMASAVIYAHPGLRAKPEVLLRQRRGQSGLWGYAISGDLPIVMLRIADVANIDLVRQMVQAHAYWRLKGLTVDLVIWNEDQAGYRQVLNDQIMGLIASGLEANLAEKPGGIFVRVAEQISHEDRDLFLSVARVIISDAQGTLAQQLVPPPLLKDLRRPDQERRLLPRPVKPAPAALPWPAPAGLQFANGLGGFTPDGREYLIQLAPGAVTPTPWVNVMANPLFGTVLSESGAAYTWFQNAHEFRLTPWSDDPVGDSCGEALYLRDEDTGYFWSPCSLPCGQAAPTVVRHGFGYTRFEHEEQGLHTDLCVHIDLQQALKYSVLTLTNRSAQRRRLSVTGYVEWVLGDLQAKTALHVQTERDPHTGTLLARNRYGIDFPDLQAYFDAGAASTGLGVTFTGDRTEFLGRLGSWQHPAAMSRTQLSNRVGAGLDPCAALRVPFELDPGQTHRVVFRLGALALAEQAAAAQEDAPGLLAADSLQTVRAHWQHTLGRVQVRTPDAALNLLFNGWLLYQTLSCRLWGRSGFYQSGGAFGFRDQLQDCMALVHAQPARVRAHLLVAAAHQFEEGDAQHWWHPPSGRGVRTHCSDDYLWLPQAVMHYVQVTGDHAVLDEKLPFLVGRPVKPEDDSYYDLPGLSNQVATLYEHCRLAVQHGLRLGQHGLPLMGSGDWNDGMNLVGAGGQGESVWLGFFLYDTLRRFAPLALAHQDTYFSQECTAAAHKLAAQLEQHGWDGAWYRRAYFDDGTPLGSASNAECQIDSIAQSWSVLSRHPDQGRARQAMAAVGQRLVNREFGFVALLDPPFDRSALNPGYIKGYLPGVRENGGQYTHAAIWSVMAWAELGQAAQAWEVFDLINPVRHSSSAAAVAAYQAEPYVMAADVYGVAPHQGRGGWTWYTGSAGWMYRLILESLLGLSVEDGCLHFKPCPQPAWTGFEIRYNYRSSVYDIAVRVVPTPTAGSPAIPALTLHCDGQLLPGASLALLDDQRTHAVELQIQRPPKVALN
jgi:cellobiose phosphorylase